MKPAQIINELKCNRCQKYEHPENFHVVLYKDIIDFETKKFENVSR